MQKLIVYFAIVQFSLATLFVAKPSMATESSTGWIVVQRSIDGTVINAWKLEGVGLDAVADNELSWRDPVLGTNITLCGRQTGSLSWGEVKNSQYAAVAKLLGIDLSKITNGKYTP